MNDRQTDWRIGLTEADEHKARVIAFDGYPQGEVYRLLRLALHEITRLREPLEIVGADDA